MIYNSVAEIFASIDKIRADLIARTENLTEDERDFRVEESSWSAANVLEHLAIVEASLVPLFFKLLKQAEAENVASDGALDPPVSFTEYAARLGAAKLEAPERICPEGSASVEESLAKLEESRTAIRGLRSRMETVNLLNTAFPHPFLGKMNAYEWLAFIGLHEARHLRQIENILAVKQENETAAKV